MQLTLIRHAETEHNRDNRVQGRADNPLSDLGERQATALAAHLAAESLVAVVSSPLQRALTTAEAIAGRHGLRVQTDAALEEMHVGEMEGLSITEMRAQFPDFLREWATERGAEQPMPGGESLRDVRTRAWSVVEQLRSQFQDEAVVLVSHNFVLGQLLTAALGMPMHDFRRFRLSVAGATTLRFRRDRTMLVRLNDTCHLRAAGLPDTDPWLSASSPPAPA